MILDLRQGLARAPVCALATPLPAANDRGTGLNPKQAMRLVADARFIEKTPLVRRLERSYTALLAAIVCGSIKRKQIMAVLPVGNCCRCFRYAAKKDANESAVIGLFGTSA
jgi:hypothetical protein